MKHHAKLKLRVNLVNAKRPCRRLGAGAYDYDSGRFFARVFLGITLSVLLHVLLTAATSWLPSPPPAPERRLLVEWIEPSAVDKKQWIDPQSQIVRKTDVPKDDLSLDQKVRRRFLSEEKQTVRKETQAAASGLTANRTGRAATEQEETTRPTSLQTKRSPLQPRFQKLPEVVPGSALHEGIGDVLIAKNPNQDPNGRVAEKSESRELTLPTDPRQNGMSTSGERLPQDIQFGDFTALNTDRFLYYSFYARIEEQIRHRWVKYVQAALYGGEVRSVQNNFETHIEIVLDRRGQYLRAIIHDSSGEKSLDAAPMYAFREAKRIPHPPREMVKDDGTIRLFYAFHVENVPVLARRRASTSD